MHRLAGGAGNHRLVGSVRIDRYPYLGETQCASTSPPGSPKRPGRRPTHQPRRGRCLRLDRFPHEWRGFRRTHASLAVPLRRAAMHPAPKATVAVAARRAQDAQGAPHFAVLVRSRLILAVIVPRYASIIARSLG